MTNKPEQLTDLRALILCEIGDFFAGFGCPGEPETPDDMQRELTMRVGRILNDHIVNYPRCEALVEILRECRIARDEAQAELQERHKPVITLYSEGIAAAANWVDQQRESYDNEHGRRDNDTGSFEFGNDAQRDYSDTLAEIAEGIRALHPSTKGGEQVRRDYAEDVNSKQAVKIGIYERIYGLLRECPGAGSIYSVAPIEGECIPHGVLAHIGCISFYCNLGHLHIAEPAAFTGCHTHSLSGGTND
ncbi:hypothetical protein WKJ17_002901 [Salmonella enterica]